MKHLFTFLLFFPLFFISCTDEPADIEPPVPEKDGHAVSVATALSELNSVLSEIDGGTRACGRIVSNVSPVAASDLLPQTRSGEAPAIGDLVYIANFENEEGYAILGADDRVPSVIAIVDEGNLSAGDMQRVAEGEYGDLSEAPIAPGVVDYLQDVGENLIAPCYLDPNNALVIEGVVIKPGQHVVYGEWGQNLVKQLPLIPMKWGQRSPYNHYAPKINGVSCPAGCGSIAAGQIVATLAYKLSKRLPTVGGRVIDWSALNQAINDNMHDKDRTYLWDREDAKANAVANFVYGVGVAIKTEFSPSGSPSLSEDTYLFFTELGFKNLYESYFDADTVYSLVVEKNLPVWMRGGLKDKPTGHAWVVDGASRQERTMTIYSGFIKLFSQKSVRYLFHCNFGYNGNSDGYYLKDLFDLGRGPLFMEKAYGDTESNSSSDFSYKKSVIYYTGW